MDERDEDEEEDDEAGEEADENENEGDERNREVGRSAGEVMDCTSVRASSSEPVDALSMVVGSGG